MDLNQLKVAVVGAGIGGLAVARALALRGARVTVLEQAPEIREVGAGLQVSPNGVAVLRALGLDQALIATRAVRAGAISLRDSGDDEVLRLDLARHAADQPHYCVHRADLIEVLADGARAAGVRLRLLHKVDRVQPGPEPVIDTCSGARLKADLVIGADGLHSKVRPALNEGSAATFTRQVAWRAVLPETGNPSPEVRLYMGPRRHLVTYPLRGGTQRNIVAVEETPQWTDEGWSQEGDPAALRALFAGFGPEVRELLSRVETVHRWGLFRHPVARDWQGEGVALLGDAAHPTLPFMAQGACLALEDAWVLADRLAMADTMPAALAGYQAARRDRAARIVAAASRNAWKYHLSLPPLRMAGHMALRLGGRIAPGAMVRQFDWIYRHDVTGGAMVETPVPEVAE
ncbi:FAD-dependent oxidoreductase [Pseudooceanicola sp. LIPI14-2-Ac024]|uniref:FAD-dependent oxidoreductase n=1 Tax=Pseudooceanicola sp. LIPI14-2-Ac024 TaxID=3344875 RepID=UPI0035CFE2A7